MSQLRQFFLARCSTISPKHDDSSPCGELAILLAPVLSDYFLVGPDRPTAPEKVELLFGTDARLRRLAQEIIVTQESEIQLMQKILRESNE